MARTNAERAEKADRLVSNYETDSSLEECLSDLLGDIRHMCDKHGIDFAERDGVGHRNYQAELMEERQGEPAWTVVGTYREGGGRYATTVYTHNPEEAELLAQLICREELRGETEGDPLDIAAVIAGEVNVLR